jgi:DNA replication regulator DPB11
MRGGGRRITTMRPKFGGVEEHRQVCCPGESRLIGLTCVEDVLNGTVHREELKASRRAEEADEPAVLKKRKKENLDSLVGELISMASIKVEPSTDRVLDVHADVMPEVTTTEEPVAPAPTSRLIRREPELRKTSLLHASRTTSFTGSSKPTGSPFELDPSLPLTAVPKSIKNEPTNTLPQIFEGLRFSHVIEEKCEGLERALEIHGGKLVREADRSRGEEVDYVVVRL